MVQERHIPGQRNFGFGMMRLPQRSETEGGGINYEEVRAMVDRFLAAGFNYFDTAAPYHGGESEVAFRECVAKRYPRETFVLADKLTIFMLQDAEEMPGFFASQLERCGVDSFDSYLLHCLNDDFFQKAEELGAFDFVLQKKREGLAHRVGFSFHSTADVLEGILEKYPEMDFVQLQINYADWDDSVVQARKCYELCRRAGKSIIVMEPVKGGILAELPDEAEMLLRSIAPQATPASWAVRYAASLEGVEMVLSGMSNLAQMEDNLSYMENFAPLNEAEAQAIERVRGILEERALIPCTECGYCLAGCPEGIPIPEYFKTYNDVEKYSQRYHRSAKLKYEDIAQHAVAADACRRCGICEARCPQHIQIPSWLEKTVERFS